MQTRRFVILFQGRSGSSFLTSVLNEHPQAGCRYEDFDTHGQNPIHRKVNCLSDEIIVDPTPKRTQEHLLNIFNRPLAATGFKFKFPCQYAAFPEITMSLLKRREDLFVIHLVRRNLVKRIVSMNHLRHLRKSTQLVSSNVVDQHDVQRFAIDIPALLDKLVLESLYSDQLAQFAERFANCLRVEYEDLLENPRMTLDRITGFLGLAPFEEIEGRFRKATPDDLRDVLENYGELESALAGTPWAIQNGGELIAPPAPGSAVLSADEPSGGIQIPVDRERTNAA